MSPKKAAISPELVKQFVNDAHGDFDSVKELISQEPALVNSSWDWGGGDWETGLGAAAHMGRRDIAEYLLENGARIDLFAAAMLGKLDIVQAVVADNPAVVNEKGPHGIALMTHARKGGKEAAEVVKFLQSVAKPAAKKPKAKAKKAKAKKKAAAKTKS
jgi:hypothetical protein